MTNSENVTERLWKGAVNCVRTARSFPVEASDLEDEKAYQVSRNSFFWGMAAGMAMAIEFLGEPEKRRIIEELSLKPYDADAVNKFLEEHDDKLQFSCR